MVERFGLTTYPFPAITRHGTVRSVRVLGRVRTLSPIAIGPRIVALLLGLAGPTPPVPLADLPAEAEVIVAELDVFDEPDDTSTIPGRLQQGDKVTVRDAEHPGWLAIEPPPGSFCWIEQSSLGTPDGQGRARVVVQGTLIRSGHPQAKIPGLPRVELTRGTVVRLLNRAPLTVGQGRDRQIWRAIAPAPGDVRHIHAAGVRFNPGPEARTETKTDPRPSPPAEIRTSYAPPRGESAISPEVATAIAQIDSLHRAILRQPIEQWRLDEVRQRYEALLRSVTDSASGNAIRAQLDEVARHEAIATDARQIETLLARSRRRDGLVALHERRLADAQQPLAWPYNVVGLIQASSRKVGGQKVFALIGRDGSTQAYLDIPPGIDVKGLMTHRVGVRGAVYYDEALRSRVISVRELEALDAERPTLSKR
jgi:hypothetical protein